MNRQPADEDAVPALPASLNAVLQAQLQALARIESILESERSALENRDPDGLLGVADAKNRALAELGELERQRKSLSASLDGDDVRELRELAARCREMNSHNAAVLNSQHQHVARLLGLLRGGAEFRPAGYDSKGRAASATGKLRLTQV